VMNGGWPMAGDCICLFDRGFCVSSVFWRRGELLPVSPSAHGRQVIFAEVLAA
jgi:hypothetical protein